MNLLGERIMSTELIRVNYPMLNEISLDFVDVAENVKKSLAKLTKLLDDLKHGGWEGPSADLFYQLMEDDAMPGVSRLAHSLYITTDVIADVLDIFANSEEAAAALLQGMARHSLLPLIEGLAFNLANPLTLLPILLSNYQAFQLAFQENNLGIMASDSGILSWMLDPNHKMFEGMNTGRLSKFFKGLGISADFVEYMQQNGLSLESLSEFGISTLAEEGFEKLAAGGIPIGEIILLANDVNQFLGGMASGSSRFTMNLITGGDTTLRSYNNMNNSIKEFDDVIHDSDLGNLFDGLGRVGTDVIQGYIEPLIERGQEFIKNPSLQTFGDLALNTLIRTTALGPVAVAVDMAQSPRLRKELIQDVAGLTGDTMDFVTSIPRLPSAYTELATNMEVGISERMIEILPVDDTTRTELLDYVEQQQRHMGNLNRVIGFATSPFGISGGILSEVNRQIDFGDLFREWTGAER
jgi:uncharacterized protein YukE